MCISKSVLKPKISEKNPCICKAFGQNPCISSVFGLNSKLSICKVRIPEGSIHISRPCCRSISKKNYYKELFEVVCRCHSDRVCLEIDQKLWGLFFFLIQWSCFTYSLLSSKSVGQMLNIRCILFHKFPLGRPQN